MRCLILMKKIRETGLFFGAVLLLTFSLSSVWAQNKPDGFSPAETDPWYLQPWVWALILSVIIMVIFFITKGGNPKNMEPDSEEGTAHE